MYTSFRHYCEFGSDSSNCALCRLAIAKMRRGNTYLVNSDSLGDGCNTQRIKRYNECIERIARQNERFTACVMTLANMLHHIDVKLYRHTVDVQMARYIEYNRISLYIYRFKLIGEAITEALEDDIYYDGRLNAADPLTFIYVESGKYHAFRLKRKLEAQIVHDNSEVGEQLLISKMEITQVESFLASISLLSIFKVTLILIALAVCAVIVSRYCVCCMDAFSKISFKRNSNREDVEMALQRQQPLASDLS